MSDQFSGFDMNFGLESYVQQQVQQPQQQHQQRQQQQQQQHQNGYISNRGNMSTVNSNANGPCMESYDPSMGIMMPQGMHPVPQFGATMAPVGGQHSRNTTNINGSNKNGVVRNSHNRHRSSHTTHGRTHSILMPNAIATSRRQQSSSSQNSNSRGHHHQQQQQQQQHSSERRQQPQVHQQHHLPLGFPDFESNFEPIPIPKHGDAGGSSGRGGVQQQLQSSSIKTKNSNNKTSSSINHRGAVQLSNHRGAVQLSYHQPQQQQQQQSYHVTASSSSSRPTEEISSPVASFFPVPSRPPQQHASSQYNKQIKQSRRQRLQARKEEWLESVRVPVPGVALEPMTGAQMIQRLEQRSKEVLARYLPCVDFLVQCQQELRKGLQVATTKRYVHHMISDTMTPRQFHTQYIAQLPERFYRKNRKLMSSEHATAAFKELQTLVGNAKGAEAQGCEVVKNTFLGGMKDGESWGLRKWLSKQGGALHICNDTECLSTACQKLGRELESTRKLAERMRPLAAAALKKLKSEIPSSYQEQSSAHPYLPFFHRLECALRAMANFDPEDDDVICIVDDDEVEELKAKASARPPQSSKRKRSRKNHGGDGGSSGRNGASSGSKRKASDRFVSVAGEDDDSDIEVLEERKPPARRSNNRKQPESSTTTSVIDTNDEVDDFLDRSGALDDTDDKGFMNQLLEELQNDALIEDSITDIFEQKSETEDVAGSPTNITKFSGCELAEGLESLASLFEADQHDKVRPDDIEVDSFWDDRSQYASALRLFSGILRLPDCTNHFIDAVDEDELIQEGKLPYTDIVKHPLCFKDIVAALLLNFSKADNSIECNDGNLPYGTTLHGWNMWKGMELLQAIDLVFLNSLAYGRANSGSSKSNSRSRTNKLRKVLWAGIKGVIDSTKSPADVDERRRCTPTRRSESSGWVVRKG